MIEIKLETGEIMRHYPQGSTPWLEYQIGTYKPAPAMAPGLYELVVMPDGDQRRIPTGMYCIGTKEIFCVSGYGHTRADAMRMAGVKGPA